MSDSLAQAGEPARDAPAAPRHSLLDDAQALAINHRPDRYVAF